MICNEDNIFVILKNGKNGSIRMPGSVFTNRHVCSKIYELSDVSVRCGTHIFIYISILWIPKSQQVLGFDDIEVFAYLVFFRKQIAFRLYTLFA